MKPDKKRTGAFLILVGIGLPIVLWFFFGEGASRGQWRHAALFSITDDIEIEFKYILGTGALIVLWGIGLILSSFFPKKGR